jgi:hypothetical protein
LTIAIWKEGGESEDGRPATPEEVGKHVKLVQSPRDGDYVLVCDAGYFLETY